MCVLCVVIHTTNEPLEKGPSLSQIFRDNLAALYWRHDGDCVALIQRMIAIYEFDTDSKDDTSFEIP